MGDLMSLVTGSFRGARYRRAVPRVVVVLSVALGLVVSTSTARPAGAAPTEGRRGRDLQLFPSNAFTVRDAHQLTGRRVALPLPDCATAPSQCDETRLINSLDGFDIDPRVEVHFGRTIDVSRVTPATVYLVAERGGAHIGINRLVWSPSRLTLYGHPIEQLAQRTTYRLVVTAGVDGDADATSFTTLSATARLEQMRRELDDGTAYADARIGRDDRGIRFTDPAGQRTVFVSSALRPGGIVRHEDQGSGPLKDETAFDTSGNGRGIVAFGSLVAPQWLGAGQVIPATPTRTGRPVPRRSERVQVIVQLPAGPVPAGGWPVAIFGHGITRSSYDSLLAGDFNAAKGIATVSLDAVGHGYGPRSTTSVTLVDGTTTTFPSDGRGRDLNADGVITDQEGIQAPVEPSPLAAVGLRDGLVQTAADEMTLVRAIARGVDVTGSGGAELSRTSISYYAQSLGGIYGTMAVATDPRLRNGLINVAGGPIEDIARLSPGFRPQVAAALAGHRPSLTNGGWDGFTESQPLWADPPVTDPAVGATAIQDYGANVDWIDRPGSPESYAPHLRLDPLAQNAPKRVLYQVAYGDKTVPNPTEATLMRAGHLQDVTTLYRNDKTPTAGSDPHGFLINPLIAGSGPAQYQAVAFLASKGATIIDPDGPAPVFEVPIADPAVLEHLNFTVPVTPGPPPEPAAPQSSAG